ncbi:MAG: B12-binding domain-containing radical SAM protein [Bacteroidales bacterium]|nr:B12-binding domain-containing radical SAM protein [Bacteroidales bacterium]
MINPRSRHRVGFLVDRESKYPPLGLGIVAALTPADWEIRLIDENFEDFAFEEADLVGITSFTSTIPRAYEIAAEYTSRKIPVVLGGIHASMVPEEAGKYVDVVATGEAESTWPEIISDFDKGRLKKRYTGTLMPMEDFPAARHDLFHKDYMIDSIQTTRGCPMQCEFCSVHYFNGRAYRTRPVEKVLDELETMQAERFFFVDDNIVGYSKKAREHAKAIFRGMIDRGIKKDWFCQASINFGEDEELLDLASEAGCRLVLVGVESEKTDALQSMNKRTNLKAGVDNYQQIFSVIQQHGISVLGTFIFALDTDTMQDLRNRVDYILNSNIDAVQVSVLTPFPGTNTYEQFKKEGRLTATNYPKDWEKYWGGEIVIKPKKLKAEELLNEQNHAVERMYNPRRLMQMMRKTLKSTKNAKAALWAFSANAHYNNMAYESEPSKHIKLETIFGGIAPDYKHQKPI